MRLNLAHFSGYDTFGGSIKLIEERKSPRQFLDATVLNPSFPGIQQTN